MKNKSKYVVLETISTGKRFWCTNSENNTHSYKGDLWYKEIAFTDSIDEAVSLSGLMGEEHYCVPKTIYSYDVNARALEILESISKRKCMGEGGSWRLAIDYTTEKEMTTLVIMAMKEFNSELIINNEALVNSYSELKEAARKMLKEANCLMDFCVDRKHLDLEDESIEGIKHFKDAEKNLMEILFR